jgi:hypothetical protein
MAVVRRGSSEFNFDGLTDSVTNLVGGLILLVVMVIGATQPKQSGVDHLPAPDNVVGEEQKMDPLLDQISALKTDTEGVEQEILCIEARLPEIQKELDELKEKHP